MYYKNFDEVWQDIHKVALQKDEIRTLAQQVPNRIIGVTDSSIIVVSKKSKSGKMRILTRKQFERYWDVLERKNRLNFKKDLPESQWHHTGAIIITFLAHLPCVEFTTNPRVLYLMPNSTNDLGTTRIYELRGIVPRHKPLTNAERKRIFEKVKGSFKRAGIPREWFKDFFHEE